MILPEGKKKSIDSTTKTDDKKDAAKGDAIVKFLWWAVRDGEKLAKALDYAPLPAAVAGKVEQAIRTITIKGQQGPALK